MGGAIRFSLLPFVALSLLLLGCGVEIAPDAITATAVAEEEEAFRGNTTTFSGSSSDDRAQSLGAQPPGVGGPTGQAVETLGTLTPATRTPTPTPEADETAGDDVENAIDDVEEAGDDSETIEDSTPTWTPVPEPTATPLPQVTDVNENFAAELLALLNAQRTGRGLGALSMNVVLSSGATEFAGYMGTAGFFGHDGPDGSTASSRAQSTGYTGAWNGEALSAGQPSPQLALNALLASPPHAAILLDPRSVEVGIGYAYVEGSRYRHYWVVMTGIP